MSVQLKLAREALEKTRQDMMDEGFHFPNEWLENIDWAIVCMGGKTAEQDPDEVEHGPKIIWETEA